MTSAAAHPEPIGTRTCARWLDGREQHLSTTMENSGGGVSRIVQSVGFSVEVGGGAAAYPRVVEIDRPELQIEARCTPRKRRP
jgi:hypothetical protein